MKRLRAFLDDTSAATAAEFALLVPLLVIFLLGTIDVGRLMWTWNRAEKATQMGVRFAVVTDPIPSDLNEDFAVQHSLVGGDPVPPSVFSSTTCNNSACTPNWGYDAAAFDALVTRMALFMPEIRAQNVVVTYRNVGLGFAGDPNGPDVAALVTVSLRNLTFQPVLLSLFGGTFNMPDFSASLTMEDGRGSESN